MSQHISGRITSCVLYEQLFVFVFIFLLLLFFRFFAIEANDKRTRVSQTSYVCVVVGYWICVSVTVKDLLPLTDLHAGYLRDVASRAQRKERDSYN